MNNREGTNNEFNVPFIVLEQPLSEQSLNFRECRNSSRYSCIPEAKCYPKTPHDIHGFFNFLDLYRKIPFVNYPDQTKSLNWECYYTNDGFGGLKHFKTSIENNVVPRRRFKNNFCRFMIYDYFITNRSSSFTKDICQTSNEYDKILPYQPPNLKDSKRKFSELNRHPNFDLRSPIKMLDNERNVVKVRNITEYDSVKNLSKSITIFEDFYYTWKEMGVKFPEDYLVENYHKRRKFKQNKYVPKHMTTNCGCFDKFSFLEKYR